MDYSVISQIELEKGQKIPLLTDVFKLFKNKIFINLDIKDKRINLMLDILYKAITEFQMQEQVALSAFNHDYYHEIIKRGLDKELEIACLYNYTGDEETSYDWTRQGTYNMYCKFIDKDKMSIATSHNKSVIGWFWLEPKQTEETFLNLLSVGIDVICTDYPDLAIQARKKYYTSLKEN